MKFDPIVIFFLLGLSLFGSSLVWAESLPSDLEILLTCRSQEPIGQCAGTDVTGDGVVTGSDLVVFRTVERGDFNQDNITDLRDSVDNQDLTFLKACIEQNVKMDCTAADLNSDLVINELDRQVFDGFIIFDFNNDLMVDFSINGPPVFLYVRDFKVNENEQSSFYIFATDTSQDLVTYTLDAVPENAIFTPVTIGDFNNDNSVDDQDVSLIEARTGYEQRFDLNNDKQVDQQDIELLQPLIGMNKQALVFNWIPGSTDSGLYEIVISAADDSGLTSLARIKLTVFDLDVLISYYSYDDVLIVVNNKSTTSQTIGDYFSLTRGIPSARIVSISTPETETISRQIFEQDIRLPIENFITANQLESNINYIVTTKGVPLRIEPTQAGIDNASVDSELSLILGPYADQIGAINFLQNPYYDFEYPFSREMFGIYLVSRLTGYTVNDVKTLIDRSSLPEKFGTFVLDVDPTKSDDVGFELVNQSLRNAAVILETAGHDVVLDESELFVTDQTSVLGYASWGGNDSSATNNGKPNFTWLPGSIAETFVSTSARTFTSPAVYGQSLIADLIAEGATGAKGYVYEPHLNSIAQPNILFDRYVKGYCLADSYFSASLKLGWQGVVVGDPKMANNHKLQIPEVIDQEPTEGTTDSGSSNPIQPDDQQPTPNSKKGSGSMNIGTLGFLLLYLMLIYVIRYRLVYLL